MLACTLLACTLPATRAAAGADLTRAARAILGAEQGVYVEAADGTVLLAQAAAHAVHPASITKIPTTLALLERFGPEHRFSTVFGASGPVLAGTLRGDLWVHGDDDPALVDEDALLVASRLNALGIRRITGNLRVSGALTFDWQGDPQGQRLARALSGGASRAAWSTVYSLGLTGAASASLASVPPAIALGTPAGPPALVPGSERTLIQYRSQPLVSLLKSLNDYSNNIFAPFAQAAGGAGAVQRLARARVPPSWRGEIALGDGAGADPRDRLSPRAAVRLLRALEQSLRGSGHHLYDVLPVAGVDEGTLHNRLNAAQEAGRVLGKTGTFGSYGASALAGAFRSARHGEVYFAILNHGVPVPIARHRQDRLVRLLLDTYPGPPWPYVRDARPAVARSQVTVASRTFP